MARIPPEELERLKREVSVERLAEARGVKLARHGADLLGLCPFHEDHEPSLVVSPGKNLWHCLGACQSGGSAIDWVMKAEGVSFRHAVELLRRGVFASGPVVAPKFLSKKRHLPAPAALEAEDSELLENVVAYYHETLKESPEAVAYLEKRGLVHPELIDTFRLGYANRTLGYRLPSKDSAAGEAMRGRLQKLGLLRESGHEHFVGCLVVPVFDAEGRVVELYGRKILPDHKQRPGTPLHLYLPGPHRGIFNLAALQASKEVILCEALIDALTFWCAGFRNVNSAYGIEGFTAELGEAFEAYGVERVLVAYDRDEAGDKAAAKLAEKLSPKGIACYRVLFPRGMDANDYARRVKPAERSLDLVLRQAQPMAGAGERPARVLEVHEPPASEILEPRTDTETEAAAKERTETVETPAIEAPVFPLAAASPAVESSATLLPAEPAPELPLDRKPHQVELVLGDRNYRVRGLERNLSYNVLKVSLFAARGESFFVDALDLYSARQRSAYVKQAAVELGVEEKTVQRDLGQLLLRLEALQEKQITAALAPKEPAAVVLSEREREEALALLRDPRLLDRIVSDLTELGVVGEATNKLAAYLAATSRKLERPLAVIVQSSSAAGKSALLDAVLSLVPEEERVAYSAMTGQSLFYMSERDLKHKVLAIAEEEGAERASYALKLLQSEGELTIASTGKDPATGRLVTHEYRVEGPVAILLTTTAIDLDEELRNRCLVLSVNESREQTRAIHDLQREAETLAGLERRRRRAKLLALHRNAQRLLRPLAVVNPYAPRLTFLDGATRTRRDHPKYLALIRAVALLHQHQREVKVREIEGEREEYLEATLADVEAANRLADEVLGRSLDELPPQTRRLLELVDEWVRGECERLQIERSALLFGRRQLSDALGLSYEQVRVHVDRLVAQEYVLAHRGSRGQSFVYELVYDGRGEDGRRFLPNLLDVEALKTGSASEGLGGSERTLGDSENEFGGPYRPETGPLPGGSRSRKTAAKEKRPRSFPTSERADSGISRLGTPSSATPTHAVAAAHSGELFPLAARAGTGH